MVTPPQKATTEETADSLEDEEDNLVLDFSGGDGGPSFVKSTAQVPETLDINTVIQIGAQDFSILLELVNQTGLIGQMTGMAGTAGITVFAPSDAAFEKAFPRGVLATLSNRVLAELVARHVIFGVVNSQSLSKDKVLFKMIKI